MRHMGFVGVSFATLVVLSTPWNTVSLAQAPAAQQAPPQRIQVSVTQIKPDMILAWEDLVKHELIPAQKKVNIPWRHTFGSGAVGQQFVRVTVTPVTTYAQFDQPAVLTRAVDAAANANYNAKTRPTLESVHTRVMTLRQDLSIVSGATTMQPLVVVQTLRLLPGRGAAFTASMVEDFLPAYRKAGVRDYWVYATNFGAPGGEFTLVRPAAKYAELDQPGLLARAGLAQPAIDKMNARRDPILSGGIETVVERFIPELSYGMPATPRGTN